MLKNSRVSYVFLYVRDLAIARSFYEKKLGFRVVEEDSAAVKYDAGDVILALNRASDYGLILSDSPDSLLVFYTPSIEPVVDRLRDASVEVGTVDRYEIGAVAELKDPDGHAFSVYEPSQEALAWPSGSKIRAIISDSHIGGLNGGLNAERRLHSNRPHWLGDCKMIYLFLFVRDAAEAAAFYDGVLGLKLLECSACSGGGPQNGVVKYDGGGVILTTHYSDQLAKKAVDSSRDKGLAVVFNVDNIERASDELRSTGLTFGSRIINSEIGKVIRFSDPNGHGFYLHEASVQAHGWPSGQKVRDVITKYAV
jgi:catechol 2,3-dioxygenase-like lactoylglutathione lyase family enzyme